MWSEENLINLLKEGGVAVIPTDTLYGIVGSALNEKTVERIYQIRKRNSAKPFIILISDVTELNKFRINLSPNQKEVLQSYWPAPISAVVDCNNKDFKYLHQGTETLAFRVPADEELRYLLTLTGPLVAPSANPEGLTPPVTIKEAKNYFGEDVDVYVDGGYIIGRASKVIRLRPDGSIEVLRS